MKTTETLRSILFDEITKLRAGESTPQRLRAIAGASVAIIKARQLDLDYYSDVKTIKVGSVVLA